MLNEKFIKVLNINLTTKKIKIDMREDLWDFLGGVGIATKLLEENIIPDKSPLDSEQPIVFAIGAISSVYPLTTKTVAMFISPLTGELGESYAGGRLAYTIFNAGFDAIVIKGKMAYPGYIVVTDNNVEFRDARAFSGVGADSTGQYIRTIEGGGGKRSIIRIGPAGENLSKIANVNVDTYRHFGRMGLGAVFGSKNLKAMQVTGEHDSQIADIKSYFKTYQEIFKKATDTTLMTKYHDLGTAINVKVLNNISALPTFNLQKTQFDKVDNISGELFAEKNLVRKVACVGCPIGCIHIGQVRRLFNEGFDYECINVSYDYELISAMGSIIGIDNSDEVLELIYEVEELGFDAIAAGCCLSWATEAYQRGIITDAETLTPIQFGDKHAYIKVLKNMACGKNKFYKHLANGISEVTQHFGGEDFGLQIAKNEMPQYHTGYGSIVGYVCGSRHSHLCNGGYSLDQKLGAEIDYNKLVDDMYKEEIGRNILNSLISCLFARSVYDTPTIVNALKSVGHNVSEEKLNEIAKRIYATKLKVKKMLGFNVKDVKIPKRILEADAMGRKIDPAIVKSMIEYFDKKNEELLKEFY